MTWTIPYHGVSHSSLKDEHGHTVFHATIEDHGTFAKWMIYSHKLCKFIAEGEESFWDNKNYLLKAKEKAEKGMKEVTKIFKMSN